MLHATTLEREQAGAAGSHPRGAAACGLTGRRHVAELCYRIPVIVLPGIMGTRLRIGGGQPPGGITWDPDRLFDTLGGIAAQSADERRRQLEATRPAEIARDLKAPRPHDLRRTLPTPSWTPPPGSRVPPAPADATRAGDDGRAGLEAQRRELEARGWGEAVWSYYRDLLVDLEAHDADGGHRGGQCPVYVAGYDWRVSTARSGRRLHRRLGEILERECANGADATQVILITHSMGGLVARAYLEEFGHERVLGVIHVAQPTHGAPVLYRRLKTGAVLKHDPVIGGLIDEGLDLLWMGQGSARAVATVVGALPGALELLPDEALRPASTPPPDGWPGAPTAWLTWDEGMLPRASDLAGSLYAEPTGQVGVVPPDLPASYAARMRANLRAARAQRQAIAGVFHPCTYWVASDGLKTDTRVHVARATAGGGYAAGRARDGVDALRQLDEVLPVRDADHDAHRSEKTGTVVHHHYPPCGDGTVPLASQLGVRPGGAGPPASSVFVVDGVMHSAICKDRRVIGRLKGWVQELVDVYTRTQAEALPTARAG